MKTSWKNISAVEEDSSYFYIFLRANEAHIIPKRAFVGPDMAQQFLEQVQTYWKSAKNGTPLAEEGSVWPPAPRRGN